MSIPAAPEAGQDLVQVHSLTKSYGKVRALNELSLTLPHGRIVGLMGDNGSGKTTLLKTLAGLVADYQGAVKICGQRPGPETKAHVSFLPDASYLANSLTVNQAIGQFAAFFDDFDQSKAHELVDHFALPGRKPMNELSKGTREKLQIALAMSRSARVFLLDEPISGVDPLAREQILAGILRDFDPDALMIISTHLIADVEAIIDSVVFLRAGHVLLAGDTDDLRDEHGMGMDQLFRKVYAS